MVTIAVDAMGNIYVVGATNALGKSRAQKKKGPAKRRPR